MGAAETAPSPPGPVRVRLDIAYDGTEFSGWARQPSLRTVQGTLEDALARILGGEPRLVVAGRTDAGVHASGQVAHLDLTGVQVERLLSRGRGRSGGDTAADAEGYQPPIAGAVARIAHRVRGALGSCADVTVRSSSIAPPGFDARFSAVWRRYEYRVADGVSGYDPLTRRTTTFVREPLNVEAMDSAARSLIGLHDFAAYCKPREGATTVRSLLGFSWARDERGVLVAGVRADAFCHSMVRALVGACVAVGQGRLDPDDLAGIRDERVRVPEVKVLAARGLTLCEVGYPEDSLLAGRAVQTRARRDATPARSDGTGTPPG